MVRLAKQRKKVRVGPEDNGRRMSLDEFDHATVQTGYFYELGNGVIEVSDIPGPEHFAQVEALRDELYPYKRSHADLIYAIAGSNESKILVSGAASERHPDLSIFTSAPPAIDVWSLWVPKIVIEVVSERSAQRDYEEKPDEYLEFGVSEYWIIDAIKGQMTAMIRWRGRWKTQVVKPPAKYTTQVLPGFSLNIKRIFATAKRK
jgi:Uma2 family endonuclease